MPEGMHDADQIEAVVNMIIDMGVSVYDKLPAQDTLLLKEEPTSDNEDDDTDVALTTAVESEFGRTIDPVRMYLREMGTMDLLTRNEEVNLAKRIEDGNRQCTEAGASCPVTIAEILRLIEQVEKEQIQLTDLLVDFVDPNAVDEPIPQPQRTWSADSTKTDHEDDTGEEDIDTGPDPEEAKQRFNQIRKNYNSLIRAIERHGIGDEKARKIQKKIVAQVMEIKLAPTQVVALWDRIKDLVKLVRAQEKALMEICVVHAAIPRETFIKTFVKKETDKELYRALLNAAGDNRNVIEQYAEEIEGHREKLAMLEQRVGIPILRVERGESPNVNR